MKEPYGLKVKKDGGRIYKTICKPCDAKRRREKHAADPEKARKLGREYYKRNAEKKREDSRKFRKNNPEKVKQQLQNWAKNNKKYIRNYSLKYKYGITLEEYEKMVIEQNGKCFICESEPKKLVVDHCHTTKKVRKLLCCSCNTFIGKIEKDEKRFEEAMRYLAMYKVEISRS